MPKNLYIQPSIQLYSKQRPSTADDYLSSTDVRDKQGAAETKEHEHTQTSTHESRRSVSQSRINSGQFVRKHNSYSLSVILHKHSHVFVFAVKYFGCMNNSFDVHVYQAPSTEQKKKGNKMFFFFLLNFWVFFDSMFSEGLRCRVDLWMWCQTHTLLHKNRYPAHPHTHRFI